MEVYRVAFAARRETEGDLRDVDGRLTEIVRGLIGEKECVDFYVGQNSDFDIMVVSAVRQAQIDCGKANSRLILVSPYKTGKHEYYEELYDEVIYPVERKPRFKQAMSECDQWLVENCDFLVAYIGRCSGEAYRAYRYAQKRKIKTVNLLEK